ncbi:hypothetical protein [Shewanella sp.]|uniref:hypothetical protein n=1 Tax=Shewanella sp. TaxID=50422 RepID=UPI003562A9BE
MKVRIQHTKIFAVLALTILLSGCPLDGDKGEKGSVGATGPVGPAGSVGPSGISCWDLNENNIKDSAEDVNQDGIVNVADCRPAVVHQQTVERTWYVASGALLFASTQADPDGPWADPARRLPLYDNSANCLLNIDPLCVADPVPDPCGLWYWADGPEDLTGSRYLKASRGYQYSVQILQDFNSANTPDDPTDDSFGWENCLASCLADSQCVGASITESGEEALACRLIAKTQFEAPIVDEYDHLGPRTQEQWPPILSGMENNFLTAIRNTIISVCPAPTP